MKLFYAISGAVLLSVNAYAADPAGKDFPTAARVEYVLACMHKRGDKSYDLMYSCSCALDYLRSQFSYEEFGEAETYRQLRSTAGERGSLFRDPEQADALRDKLDAAEEAAEKRCFFKNVSASATE